MPDDQTNPDGPPSVKEARALYEKRKKQRARFRRRWVKAKHRVRKAKHKVQKAIDRRKAAQAGHKENEIRDRIVDYAFWAASHEPDWHYAQVRPYPSNPRQLPMNTDCSGFTTLAQKDAGGQDPNGSSPPFNGYGFTGTQASHCPHIPKSEAKPGDSLEHGDYPGSHINILLEPGSKADPMVMSHGQESGPRAYPASVEINAHLGQAVVWLKTV